MRKLVNGSHLRKEHSRQHDDSNAIDVLQRGLDLIGRFASAFVVGEHLSLLGYTLFYTENLTEKLNAIK